MIKLLVVLVIIVFLSTTEALTVTDDDDFYSSFHGNLDESDRNLLSHICGKQSLLIPRNVVENGGTVKGKVRKTLDEVQFRSLGGVVAKNHEYPWTIGIRIRRERRKTSRCSGVLISRRHVITAAHCVIVSLSPNREKPESPCLYEPLPNDRLSVYPGTRVQNLKKIPPFTASFRVVNKTIHPGYDICSQTNDVALLEISPNMFSEGTPICMPSANEEIPDHLTSAGFGLNPDLPDDTRPLQTVDLKYGLKTWFGTIITSTKDRAPCTGDSGGPLFKVENGTYILLGITARSEDCKRDIKEKLGVFENVMSKLDWICSNSGVCPANDS